MLSILFHSIGHTADRLLLFNSPTYEWVEDMLADLYQWAMWKSIGTNGIAKIIENEFYLADFARTYINKNINYKLYSFGESLSVCFNYKDFDPEDLCAKLYKSNTLMVGFGRFKNKRFIRLVVVNCENSAADLIQFFQLLEAYSDKNSHLIKRRN